MFYKARPAVRAMTAGGLAILATIAGPIGAASAAGPDKSFRWEWTDAAGKNDTARARVTEAYAKAHAKLDEYNKAIESGDIKNMTRLGRELNALDLEVELLGRGFALSSQASPKRVYAELAEARGVDPSTWSPKVVVQPKAAPGPVDSQAPPPGGQPGPEPGKPTGSSRGSGWSLAVDVPPSWWLEGLTGPVGMTAGTLVELAANDQSAVNPGGVLYGVGGEIPIHKNPRTGVYKSGAVEEAQRFGPAVATAMTHAMLHAPTRTGRPTVVPHPGAPGAPASSGVHRSSGGSGPGLSPGGSSSDRAGTGTGTGTGTGLGDSGDPYGSGSSHGTAHPQGDSEAAPVVSEDPRQCYVTKDDDGSSTVCRVDERQPGGSNPNPEDSSSEQPTIGQQVAAGLMAGAQAKAHVNVSDTALGASTSSGRDEHWNPAEPTGVAPTLPPVDAPKSDTPNVDAGLVLAAHAIAAHTAVGTHGPGVTNDDRMPPPDDTDPGNPNSTQHTTAISGHITALHP